MKTAQKKVFVAFCPVNGLFPHDTAGKTVLSFATFLVLLDVFTHSLLFPQSLSFPLCWGIPEVLVLPVGKNPAVQIKIKLVIIRLDIFLILYL